MTTAHQLSELHAKMESKLKAAGLASESVKVFGTSATCVHIRCIGRDTATRWAALLAQVFGKAPTVAESSWEAAENRATCLKPTMRRGYLVALIAR